MISIVMSYYNRLHLLRNTLKTLSASKIKDFEVVIVDDYSNQENSLDTIASEFKNINFQIIKMSVLNPAKIYNNPCVPYNVGFRASKGNKIIIQNPECCHVGDVIEYVESNITDENYLSFHCFACDRNDLKLLHAGEKIQYEREQPSKARWYNHKIHRPAGYHFCTAITRNNLKKLNGFDERFAHGHSYDDDEFLQRIKNLNLRIEFVETPHVIHQYHGKSFNNPLNPPIKVDNAELHAQVLEEKLVRANNKENIL
jgi:GT2 family glycosyltransferase